MIVSTGEALMERRIAEIPASEWDDLSIDLTPREYVLDFLEHAFPVQLQEPFEDDDGSRFHCPSPLRNSRASVSVVDARVAFERRSPRKSRSALRPAGGSSPSSLRRKLFIDAHASISVPSTEKCSSDKSRRTRAPRSTA